MELSFTTTTTTFPHRTLQPITPTHRRTPKLITFPKASSFPILKSSLRNPNPNPNLLSTFKTTVITGVTVAALFLTHFHTKPSLAAPPPPPEIAETTESDEKTLEDHLCDQPNDVKTIKALMEVKIKNGKVHEAIALLNQLIDIEPNDSEWKLLKYHLHSYSGDHESAKLGFEEIIRTEPLKVEAYHGLVMSASAKEDVKELENVEKRILEGMEVCKKGKRKEDVRDFKLLLAQIRVIRGEYSEALGVYEELCKEEPLDFRPYLCRGIIYTLLGKNDEAEKMFGKYRRLVPKGHPYTRYFDDNMVATKVFAQKVETERAYSKS